MTNNQLQMEPAKRTLTAMHILETAKATAILLLGVAALIAAIRFATPAGSYQLLQLGDYRRDQYLLDKQSGRVWHIVCTGNATGADCAGDLVWVEMRRR